MKFLYVPTYDCFGVASRSEYVAFPDFIEDYNASFINLDNVDLNRSDDLLVSQIGVSLFGSNRKLFYGITISGQLTFNSTTSNTYIGLLVGNQQNTVLG